MKKNLILALIPLLFIGLFLMAKPLTSTSQNAINFKIKNAGFYVSGRFEKPIFTVSFDESNLNISSLKGIAQVENIKTGISLRDTHLKEKVDFFDGKKNPTLTMQSVSIKKESEGNYTVLWNLTMKGITKSIKTSVTTTQTSKGLEMQTKFAIDRNHWKVGGDSFTMGDLVSVNISTILN